MLYGVLSQSITPVRKEPFEHSEMVTQLLFGETFLVLEQHRDWLRVELTHDGYPGWIDVKSSILMDQEEYDLLSIKDALSVASRLFVAKAENDEYPIRLCPGSSLYNYIPENGTFSLPGKQYKTFSIPFEPLGNNKLQSIEELAKYFINSPYLWGGRSPYGIDCSGLTQVIFKMVGVSIPRDASQQVFLGQTVEFVSQYRTGDLAFFGNAEGNITHVGIVLNNNHIIHSSGFVRLDKLDQQGIFSVVEKKYTHQLRVVKRLIFDS